MGENKPLSGIRVIELSTYLAAPVCARILGDWGADVIKVESVHGDPWRNYGPRFNVPSTVEENPVFSIANSNKRNLALDLKTPEGLEVLHRLLETADVFVTNNRLSALRRMGLDYDAIKDRYPRLVYALLTGYGEKGPDAGKPGFDTSAFWAAGGFYADMKLDEPGNYPVYTPAGIADMLCGTILSGAVGTALAARERTGKGDKVSCSLFGTAVWGMGVMDTITQERYGYHYPKKRREGRPTAIPYLCGDGEWIMLSILEHERYFPDFCRAIDRPELAEDPRFATFEAANSMENRAALIEILEAQFLTRSADEWDARLGEVDIVHDKLAHYYQISKSVQVLENHFMDEITFANGAKAMLPRPPVWSENLGVPDYRLPEELGADTEEILREAGFSGERIDALAERKIVRKGAKK